MTYIKTAWLLHNARQMANMKATPLGIIDEQFKEQNEFVADSSTFVTAWTTRRAGKSTGLGLKFFRMANRHPRRLQNKNIMLPNLMIFSELQCLNSVKKPYGP